MLVQEARDRIRDAAKVDSVSYPDNRVDRCLITVLEDFMMETKCTTVSGTVAVVGTSQVVTISGLTRFRPERIKFVEFYKINESTTNPGLLVEVVNYKSITNSYSVTGTAVGTSTPKEIAFRDETTAVLKSTPGTTYNRAMFTYFDRLDSWTPGGIATGTNVLNIPDEFIVNAIWDGATSYLMHNDPKSNFQNAAYQRYRDYVRRVAGRTGIDSLGSLIADEADYL